MLAHAGPSQLPLCDPFPRKGSLCCRQTVDGITVRQASFFRIVLHGIRPQLRRQQGKYHIAAVGKGVAQSLLPVGPGTNNGLVPDPDRSLAVPGSVFQLRDLFQSSRQCHGLINRTGCEGRGQEPVQISSLIPLVGLKIAGNKQRIVTGRGHHAEDLSRFIVVHCHGAGMALQGLIRLVVVTGIKGQVQFRPLLRTESAVDQIIACQFIRKGIQRTRSNVALQVTHRMKGGFPHIRIIIIGTFPVFRRGQDVSVPIQNGASRQHAIGIVQMAVKGRGSPIPAAGHISEQEQSQADCQHQGQNRADHGPSLNLPHPGPPLPQTVPQLSQPVSVPPLSTFSAVFAGWQN